MIRLVIFLFLFSFSFVCVSCIVFVLSYSGVSFLGASGTVVFTACILYVNSKDSQETVNVLNEHLMLGTIPKLRVRIWKSI